MINKLTDIIGKNSAGESCHPYQLRRKPHTGLYSYSFDGKTGYQYCDESELRKLIEAGRFNSRGTIRMIPKEDKTLKRSGAISVQKYKDKFLPIWEKWISPVAAP